MNDTTKDKYYNKFLNNGFVIIKIFSKSDIDFFKKKITSKINSSLGFKKKFDYKDILNFHLLFNKNEKEKILISKNRRIPINLYLKNKVIKNKFLNLILNKLWGHKEKDIYWVGNPEKKEFKKNFIGFRVVRPKKNKDAAKYHIDAYSRNDKSFVSIWVPIQGFSNLYSMGLLNGSHKIFHKKEFFNTNKKVISKIFKKKYISKFRPIKPNLKPGECVLFHSNLIHGGGINTGQNSRVSVEFRIFNKKFFNKNTTFNWVY